MLLNITFVIINIYSSIMKLMITFSGGVDYNDTIIKCIFPAGVSTPQVSNRVEIIDDTIDEDRQFFLVLLEVESATNKDRVKLTNSITKCNINDNDGEDLIFSFDTNTFLMFTLLYKSEVSKYTSIE